MKTKAVLAMVLAFVSVWFAEAAGLTFAWMTGGVRAAGLVVLATAIVASLLVRYFDWRRRLMWRRVRGARDADQEMEQAA